LIYSKGPHLLGCHAASANVKNETPQERAKHPKSQSLLLAD